MNRYGGNRKGNIVAMMMVMVGMMGVAGVTGMNLLTGPISTASKVTHQNMAQNDLLMNAKVVVMNASTRLNMGDEDSDGYIEPVPFVPTSDTSCGLTLPGEGGCLPHDIGAILTDPWGTQYAYCVWDHGDVTGSANRIDGEDSTSGAVLAIISAGPDKRFETPCSAYDGDPETNDIAINPDGVGDDLVQIYTYAGAVAGSGGLWVLKDGEPETAVIDKKLEVGNVAAGTGFAFDTTTGEGEFPYIKTDFLASKSGGTTPVTMDSNIALDGRWLSGDGGNEGIYVDANGKVGIGTAVPDGLLEVVGFSSDPISLKVTNKGSGNARLWISAAQHGASALTYFRTLRADGVTPYYWNMGSNGAADHRFEIGRTTQLGNPRFTILHNGNVGIDTAQPDSRLHVVDTGSNAAKFGTIKDEAPYPANSHDIARLTIDAAGASYPELYLRNVESSSISSSLLSSGHLYVGTTGPVLDISMGHSNGYVAGDPSKPNHVSRVFIDNSTGNVGIGTSNPLHHLHIKGTGGDEGTASIFLQDPTASHEFGGRLYYDDTNGKDAVILSAVNNGVDSGFIHINRLTGRVGINIDTGMPTETLQVNGRIDVTNNRILRVATPTAATDAANKAYVDSLGNRSCANGQILKFQSGSWACAGDNAGGGPDNLGGGGTTTGTLYSKSATGYGFVGQDGNNLFRFDAGAGIDRVLLRVAGTWMLEAQPTTLFPYLNNSIELGTSARRWKNGWFSATGTVTAGAFVGSGASLTNLNASNLATGTVPIARIGTGTKNTSTFLRGDGTFSNTLGGNLTATAFLYGSDERLKADIRPLGLSLDDLDGIHAYRYRYKADEDQTPRIGVIAQEVQAVFPEAVKTGEDGMMSVDYPALVPVLLEAVKQLKAENDAIRRQMKADNDNLRMEIRALTKAAR